MAVPTASDNIFPKLILDEGGTLGTVTAGERRLGIDANGVLVWKNSAGTTSPLVALNKWDATTAPTANEDSGDGYQPGSRWIDVTNDKEYVCLDATAAAAVWTETTAAAGAATALQSGRVVRSSGNITTTSTSFVDVTGASITITTGARKCLVGVVGVAHNSDVAGQVVLDVNIDGTREGAAATTGLLNVRQHATASEHMNISFTHLTDTLTAASHTFKLQWLVGTGTATILASDPVFVFWVAELYV